MKSLTSLKFTKQTIASSVRFTVRTANWNVQTLCKEWQILYNNGGVPWTVSDVTIDFFTDSDTIFNRNALLLGWGI